MLFGNLIRVRSILLHLYLEDVKTDSSPFWHNKTWLLWYINPISIIDSILVANIALVVDNRWKICHKFAPYESSSCINQWGKSHYKVVISCIHESLLQNIKLFIGSNNGFQFWFLQIFKDSLNPWKTKIRHDSFWLIIRLFLLNPLNTYNHSSHIFGFWYLGHFSGAIFFPFCSVFPILPGKM